MIQTLQFRAAVSDDIEQIKHLQNANLYARIAEEERSGGFVTTPFTSEQFQNRISDNAAFVAQNDSEIVAYVLAGNWDFYAQWPIFPFMIARLANLTFRGVALNRDNTFQYGPVCIARNCRGKGVLPPLFQMMRANFQERFASGLSFINQQNARSLAAHRKLGLEIVDEFAFDERRYFSLAFATGDEPANIEYSNP